MLRNNKFYYEFLNRSDIKNELINIKISIGQPIDAKNYLNIIEEKNIKKYYFPCEQNVFKFMNIDISDIKFIILGMDPYMQYYIFNNQIIPIATGRSFEISNMTSWKQKIIQKSIINIFKSLYYNKYGINESINNIKNNLIEVDDLKNFKEYQNNKFVLLTPRKWFDWTEKNGVLWLNATLTVKPLESDSHTKIWSYFMSELIKYIVYKNSKIKWIVFGQKAKNRISNIVKEENIIYTCHPASRVNNTFVEDNVFKNFKFL